MDGIASRFGLLALAGVVGCSDPAGEQGETDGGSDTDGATGGTSDATASGSASQGGTSAGDETGSSAGMTSGSGSDSATETADATTGAPANCPGGVLEPGMHNLQLEHDGLTRDYQVYVPAGHDGQTPASLVLNFHGYTSNAGQQVLFSEMNADADERGVIVVYPDGYMSSWNAGVCCGGAMSGEVDDVGFVRALIEELSSIVCMDPDRVYATGMSNGGFLSHRLACEAADVIAAIGPVAGPLGIPPEDCQPARPIPVIHFHGTADTIVPYAGNGVGFPNVPEMSQDWADRNGCDAQSEVTLQMGDTTCETWTGCDEDASVTLCTIEGMGHCWPGNAFCPVGAPSTTISSNALMLDLFEMHTL